ncbi:MAG: hypothetical protein R2860_09660 [Desulfobacterales bacterium]
MKYLLSAGILNGEKVESHLQKWGSNTTWKLAAISGVNGVFSDEDIAKVRDLALEARNQMGEKTIDAPHSRRQPQKNRRPTGRGWKN